MTNFLLSFYLNTALVARTIRQRYCLGTGIKGVFWPFFYSLQCWAEYLASYYYLPLHTTPSMIATNFWDSLDQYDNEGFDWENGRSPLVKVVDDYTGPWN